MDQADFSFMFAWKSAKSLGLEQCCVFLASPISIHVLGNANELLLQFARRSLPYSVCLFAERAYVYVSTAGLQRLFNANEGQMRTQQIRGELLPFGG